MILSKKHLEIILNCSVMKNYITNLKYDIPAGIVVFLVAVPLCLGIALASGAPLYSGMIAGMVGGIVIGLMSNSQLSVSGPAAGLAAIVFMQIQTLGSFQTFLLAVVIAGVMQVLLGLAKAGTIGNYFPSNVIKGMLTAIGILIILKQIPHAFGYDKDTEGDLSFQQADGENTFSEIWVTLTQHIHWGSTLIALICLGLLILWEKPFMKSVKLIPGALVGVVLSVVLNQIFVSMGSSLAISHDDMVNVPVAKDFSAFLAQFTAPDFSQIGNKAVYIAALTLAIVASIETLLCIEAVDKLDPHRRTTNSNRELFAQGTGNIISGLLGGLPVTSVIVRSSANVAANAQTKVSTIFHGALILFCVALIPNILNMIPLSALAAVLLFTGYKLAKPAVFKQMWAAGKYQFVPFIVTVVAIVFTDLLTGVGIGLAVAIFAILRGNMKTAYFFDKDIATKDEDITIHLAQEVSFLNKASIKQTLFHLPKGSTVVIDASDTAYIDYDVLETIKEFQKINAPERNIKLKLIGFKNAYQIENTEKMKTEIASSKKNAKASYDKLVDDLAEKP
jgi:MFS superfamily sulfate permease-like transporter